MLELRGPRLAQPSWLPPLANLYTTYNTTNKQARSSILSYGEKKGRGPGGGRGGCGFVGGPISFTLSPTTRAREIEGMDE